MISRIRLNSYGSTAALCSQVLHDHANLIEEMLGVSVSRGEEVIQRSLAEPDGCDYAYEGRLTLHPDVARAITNETMTVTSLTNSGI